MQGWQQALFFSKKPNCSVMIQEGIKSLHAKARLQCAKSQLSADNAFKKHKNLCKAVYFCHTTSPLGISDNSVHPDLWADPEGQSKRLKA